MFNLKNKIIIAILVISIVALSGCTEKSTTGPINPEDVSEITNFDECIAAGNPAMESYPRQCTDGTNTFTEEIEVEVETPKACTREYMPVCGEVQVQCIKAPCPPIKTTFSNKCEAENANAMNIVEGECEDEEVLTIEKICIDVGGKWLENYQECEYMPEETCINNQGKFLECESACRHENEEGPCTQQCVLVCDFKTA